MLRTACQRNFVRSASTAAAPMWKELAKVPAATPQAATAFGAAQVTRLDNGVTVATVQSSSLPIAQLAIVSRAGARFETHATRGATHHLTHHAFKSTESSTVLRVTREAELFGTEWRATASQELLTYSSSVLWPVRGEEAFSLLAESVSSPAFFQWEVEDISAYVERDLEENASNAQLHVLSALHQLSFREGLGNSLLSPSHRVGLNSVTLRDYYKQNVVPGNTAVVGVGVPHEQLVSLTKANLFKGASAGASARPSPAVFHANNEHRIHNGSKTIHSAIGFKGASLGGNHAAAAAVLRAHLGGEKIVSYGISSGALGQALQQSTAGDATATAFSLSYSDAGLFGIYTISSAKRAGAALSSALQALRNAASKPLSAESLARAQAIARSAVLQSVETRGGQVEDIASQVLLTGKHVGPSDSIAAINAVTAAQVGKLATEILSHKFNFVTFGDLDGVPHIDELAVHVK